MEKLSEYLENNGDRTYRYVGTVWGDKYLSSRWVENGMFWAAAVVDLDVDDQLTDHPTNTGSREDCYYIQSGNIHRQAHLINECVLELVS